MPPREWRLRVEDILEAAGKIARYTAGLDLASFQGDERTVDAVMRNLIVIGEAAGSVPAEVAERFPEVPWRQMRAMRNIVAHHYFAIDLPIVWETVRHDLPPLVPILRRLLDESPL